MEPEPKRSVEAEKEELLSLVADLGMVETEEMLSLRSALTKISYKDASDEFLELFKKYRDLGADEFELLLQNNPNSQTNLQIGYNLMSALIFISQESMRDDFYEEIEDGITYAENMGQDDLARKLKVFTQIKQP